MYELTGFIYSIVAGITTILLLLSAIRRRSEILFIFSLLFLIVSWSGIEWSLWLYGKNLFDLVFTPIIPLLSYFVVWTAFIIYISEKHFKRRDWIFFLILVTIIIIIAHFCMNCLFT